MKHVVTLSIALAVVWMMWSGYLDNPFLLSLGGISVALSVWIAARMGVTDEEGTPLGLGLRPLVYAAWLCKEIVLANIHVTRVLLDPQLPIHPKLICVHANQRTELGRVILANSITLTPGTVSVDLFGDSIWVHTLSLEGTEEDVSGDMGRRVCALER